MDNVPTDLSIYFALTADPDTTLLRTFSSTYMDVEPLRVRKTIYLPTPFVGLFHERDLTPAEAWTRLRGSIIDGVQEVHCRPIINWLRVSLTMKMGKENSPLAMPQPTVPLNDGDLLWHRHHMLTRHLPGMDPTLQRFQGLLIATHIGEVGVDLRRDR